ncbi:putative gustatory receptor 28b [Vespa mandarinia]|uniref:putative gustatory receptor 28b n=1 Tax=Vespa mandarinia TaxID=7446 RepID=UPI00161FCD34|nr:putative gustatory receptor 28b [Vespa mandarinia]
MGSVPYFFFSSLCKVIFVSYTCDDTTQKMEKINEIVYTFYAENTDYIIQQEVKMFTLQMAHCQSTYSTFGLYSFNRKYIYSCIGMVMTYLTIMIQMSDPVTK